MSTLVLVNRQAAGGRAFRVWERLRPVAERSFGELDVRLPSSADEVESVLREGLRAGASKVIGLGGDGTNHRIVNALFRLRTEHAPWAAVPYGQIPVGTGRDFARSIGLPLDPAAAVSALARCPSRETDAVRVRIRDRDGAWREHVTLNVASVGASAEVAGRVNRALHRRPWTFLLAAVATILEYPVRSLRIETAGRVAHDGPLLLFAVANGSCFGRGMRLAPDADLGDGLLDFLVLRSSGRLEALQVLARVYGGRHLSHSSVTHFQGTSVRVVADSPISFELDGEGATGVEAEFTLLPAAIRILRP